MRRLIQFFAATLSVILIAAGLHSQPGSHRLLFIGIDGCRPDAVEGATAPNLHQILDDGIASPDALTLYPTWSANGWSTMLTGVNHLKHLAKINSFPESNFDDYPDFITHAEAWYPDFNSFSVVQWNPINYNIIQNCDNEITASSDYDVALASIDILQNEDPHILFIAFNDVDAAGHAYGFHPDIQPYREAIEQTDFYISQIRDALIQRPDFENENWMIAVATDHGGIPAGHGGGTLEERNAFTCWFQSGIEAEELEREVLPDASSVSYVQLP
ncbi:MAG: alkaline phosphatase family protein, partial [Flavobacteriales bacterium]|nr:alkaline phosphatase family protein [Flavobacteriales bacterium]